MDLKGKDMNKNLINILTYIVEIASMLAFFSVIGAIPGALFLAWYMVDTYSIALPIALLCGLTAGLITAGLTCTVGICCALWSKALESEKESTLKTGEGND